MDYYIEDRNLHVHVHILLNLLNEVWEEREKARFVGHVSLFRNEIN